MSTDLQVKDLMDKKFEKINEKDSINKVISKLMKKGLTGILVINDVGELVGRLSEKECLAVCVHQIYHALPVGVVKDHMSKIELSVPSSMSVSKVAEVFLNYNYRRIPVLDAGKLVGQITRRDLIRGLHLYFFSKK